MRYILGAGGFAAELYQWMKLEGSEACIDGFLVEDNYYDPKMEYLMDKKIFKISEVDVGSEYYFGISSPALKRQFFERLMALKCMPVGYQSQNSLVSSYTKIGVGVVICPYCTISPNVVIEDFVTINCRVGIGHDSRVGRFSTLLGNNAINGNVTIGSDSLLGSGSIIYPGKKIGNGCTVGVGATVIRSVSDEQTVFGNPARKI